MALLSSMNINTDIIVRPKMFIYVWFFNLEIVPFVVEKKVVAPLPRL